MKLFIAICIQAIIFNKASVLGLSLNQNKLNSYMTNNFGFNNLAAISGLGSVNPSFTSAPNGFGNFLPNNIASTNSIANNEALFNANFVQNRFAPRNAIAASEMGGKRNAIANANAILANEPIVGNAVLPSSGIMAAQQTNLQNGLLSNMQFTPVISDFVPSLQYGDISMTGDLPIGGMIKVCGCFPVYGMVNVDGSLPSAGKAIVAESFGNQVIEIVNNCAHQVVG